MKLREIIIKPETDPTWTARGMHWAATWKHITIHFKRKPNKHIARDSINFQLAGERAGFIYPAVSIF